MDDIAVKSYHEAGHAYAHLYFNLPLDEVCVTWGVDNEPPIAGHTEPSVTMLSDYNSVDRIAALLAGGEAEAKYRQINGDSGGEKGNVTDQVNIEKIKKEMDPKEAEQAEREALHKVQAMIDTEWRNINIIGKALLEGCTPFNGIGETTGCLSGDEVVEIVNSANKAGGNQMPPQPHLTEDSPMSSIEEENNNSNLPSQTEADSSLYSALVSFYLHKDQLLWSRTQLLIAVQAGVLASGYHFKSIWLGPIVMVLGALLTFMFLQLVEKDRSSRDANLELMETLEHCLIPDSIKNHLESKGKRWKVRYVEPSGIWWAIMRGRVVIRVIIFAFMAVDIILAGLYIFAVSIFTA